jgi:RNA polymerase-binding transcription factor DksA
MTMLNPDVVRRQLQARLAQLEGRIGRIEEDLRSAHDRDWPERANELQNDDVLEGLDDMSLKEAQQIRDTLQRIEAGQYGVCAQCGQSIGEARLRAAPTAVTCVHCAPE